MRYIVLNNATWDPVTFIVNSYLPTITSIVEEKYHFNAETNGLSQFLKNGKKVMIWHGSDDSLVSHKDTIRTWREVTDAAGASATDNSRLYIASGVNHCIGGSGADIFDLLTPMMSWVEKGTQP